MIPVLAQTRSLTTRLLHMLLAFAIVTQLALSLGMEAPEEGRPGNTLFEIHEKVGLAALAILVTFWVWSLVRHGEARFSTLFPWLRGERRRAFRADLVAHARALRGGVIPLTEGKPFASAIHGLGLLIATLMATTGALGYFVPQTRFLLEVHETAAPLMWAYLIGHAGVAVVHQIKGDALITRMFSIFRR